MEKRGEISEQERIAAGKAMQKICLFNGMSVTDFIRQTHSDTTTIYRLIQGKPSYSGKKVLKLAQFLGFQTIDAMVAAAAALPEFDPVLFGAATKLIMDERGMSDAELAEKVSVEPRSINGFLNKGALHIGPIAKVPEALGFSDWNALLARANQIKGAFEGRLVLGKPINEIPRLNRRGRLSHPPKAAPAPSPRMPIDPHVAGSGSTTRWVDAYLSNVRGTSRDDEVVEVSQSVRGA